MWTKFSSGPGSVEAAEWEQRGGGVRRTPRSGGTRAGSPGVLQYRGGGPNVFSQLLVSS